jgi:hypothetical protein
MERKQRVDRDLRAKHKHIEIMHHRTGVGGPRLALGHWLAWHKDIERLTQEGGCGACDDEVERAVIVMVCVNISIGWRILYCRSRCDICVCEVNCGQYATDE